MSCEMVSSRKIDYYVNDPYVTIIDIREEDKFLHARIRGAIHFEYNKLMENINNIFRYGKVSYEFQRLFSNKDRIYIFYCDKGAASLVVCEKMSDSDITVRRLLGDLMLTGETA